MAAIVESRDSQLLTPPTTPKVQSPTLGAHAAHTFVWPYNDGQVSLAGEFTQWEPVPMQRRENEEGFEHTVALTPGRKYLYKFVVNGHNWTCDYNNLPVVSDEHGNQNHEVVVEAKIIPKEHFENEISSADLDVKEEANPEVSFGSEEDLQKTEETTEDIVEKEETIEDIVEKEETTEDTIEKEETTEDIVEKEETTEDVTEKEETTEDVVEEETIEEVVEKEETIEEVEKVTIEGLIEKVEDELSTTIPTVVPSDELEIFKQDREPIEVEETKLDSIAEEDAASEPLSIEQIAPLEETPEDLEVELGEKIEPLDEEDELELDDQLDNKPSLFDEIAAESSHVEEIEVEEEPEEDHSSPLEEKAVDDSTLVKETETIIAEPAVEVPAKDVVEEAPIEEVSLEATVIEEAPIEEVALEATVIEEAPIEEVALEATVIEEAPIEEVALEATVIEEAAEEPIVDTPLQDVVEETTQVDVVGEPFPAEPVPSEPAEKLIFEPTIELFEIGKTEIKHSAAETIEIEETVITSEVKIRRTVKSKPAAAPRSQPVSITQFDPWDVAFKLTEVVWIGILASIAAILYELGVLKKH